jgi:hypothetical protein
MSTGVAPAGGIRHSWTSDGAFDLHPPRILESLDFSRWIEDRARVLVERWLADLKTRTTTWNGGVQELMRGFLELFLETLPVCLGPLREQAEPLWLQTAELFGSFSAQRGLAAGEVIEEFQVLRESVIRLLWADPPPLMGSSRTALREALRLNRVLDKGITHASVGHTDALFFALFQGSGVPEHLTDDVRYEIRHQLESIRREVQTLAGHTQRVGAGR